MAILMASSKDHSTEPRNLGPTSADKLFMVFLVSSVIAVTALGVVNYRDRGDIEECCQALFDACEGFSARLESLNSAALDG